MKRNTDYKNDALAALKGNWGKAVLATVIYMAIVYIAMGPYLYQNFKFQAAMTAAGGAMDAQALLSEVSTMYGFLGLYGLLTIFLVGRSRRTCTRLRRRATGTRSGACS